MRALRPIALLGLLAAIACSTDSSGLGTGAVQVTLGLQGVDLDPDGFFVTVDGGSTTDFPGSGSATIDADAGQHEVVLGGLAPNCIPNGSGSRTVTINPPDTAKVSFVIACAAVTGVVKVQATFAGLSPDTNGYQVRLDGGLLKLLLPTGAVVFPGISGGSHAVDLDDVAANCSPAGTIHADVIVPVGGFTRDTGRVTFPVTCTPTGGWLRVSAVATGTNPDASIQVGIDDRLALPLATGLGALTAYLAPGNHAILLEDIAPNCAVTGSNPVNAVVVAGDTTDVAFSLACAATSIQISAIAIGVNPDTTFQLSVDGAPAVPISSGASVVVGGLSAGSHSVLLSGIATNCLVTGPNPALVTTIADDTVAVAFSLVCAERSIQVSAVATGVNLDTTFQFSIDGAPAIPISSGASVVVGGLAAGSHSVFLSDITSNCAVVGPNPTVVTTIADDTVDVAFSVHCLAAPATGVSFYLTTTGSSLDTLYHLTIFGGCGYYCYTPVWEGDVPSNGNISADLPVGYYEYSVLQVAPNCTGPTYGWFNITSQQGARVDLAYSCVTYGSVVVGAQSSGTDVDVNFFVLIDNGYGSSLVAGDSVLLDAPVGTRSVTLGGVQPNCTVNGPNPVSVTVDSAATSHVNFVVTCVANPTLHVTVTTTGPNAPAGYLVGVDPDYYYGYSYSANIAANGAASISLPPGSHYVTLDQVPAQCSVTSQNNVTVNMVIGVTTNLAFTVTCQ